MANQRGKICDSLSRGFLAFIVTLALIAGVAYGSTDQLAYEKLQPEQSNNPNRENGGSIVTDFNTWPEESPAQWAMALFNGLSVLVSILAVCLLYRTWRATRDVVTVTRDIGRAQTRAYISCTGGTLHFDDEGLWVHVCIKNNGQSPTKAVEFSDANLSYYFNGSARLRNPFTRDMTHAPNVACGEAELAKILFEGVNEDDFPRFDHVTINVTVRWQDVFDCWDCVEYMLSNDGGNSLKVHKI